MKTISWGFPKFHTRKIIKKGAKLKIRHKNWNIRMRNHTTNTTSVRNKRAMENELDA